MDGARLPVASRAVRIAMSALVLIATLATSGMAPAAAETIPAWPKARFDAGNTAFNTAESWLSTGNVASSALDWSTRINPKESPLVAGGMVYAGCEGDSFVPSMPPRVRSAGRPSSAPRSPAGRPPWSAE